MSSGAPTSRPRSSPSSTGASPPGRPRPSTPARSRDASPASQAGRSPPSSGTSSLRRAALLSCPRADGHCVASTRRTLFRTGSVSTPPANPMPPRWPPPQANAGGRCPTRRRRCVRRLVHRVLLTNAPPAAVCGGCRPGTRCVLCIASRGFLNRFGPSSLFFHKSCRSCRLNRIHPAWRVWSLTVMMM